MSIIFVVFHPRPPFNVALPAGTGLVLLYTIIENTEQG